MADLKQPGQRRYCTALKEKLPEIGRIKWQPLPTAGFLIGKFEDDNEELYFNGQVDDVAVWNYALDSDDVSYLWNGGTGRVAISITP